MSNPDTPWQDGDPCGRKMHPGDLDQKCFFHTWEEKDADAFVTRFVKLVEASGEEGVDATRFVFPTFHLPEDFEFPGPAVFRQATFTGATTFCNVKFSGGDANFMDAKFSGGDTDFVGAEFSGGTAIFAGAEFSGGSADFGYAKFSGGHGRFGKAEFSGGNAIFLQAVFSGGDTDFQGAKFSVGYAFFEDTRFSGGDADFEGAQFSGDSAIFVCAEFSGEALFARIVALTPLHFRGSTFKRLCDFTGAVLLPLPRDPSTQPHGGEPGQDVRGGLLDLEGATFEAELRLQDVQTPRRALAAWRFIAAARHPRVWPLTLHLTNEGASAPDVRVNLQNINLGPEARVRLLGVQGAGAAGLDDKNATQMDWSWKNEPEVAVAWRTAADAVLVGEDDRRRLDATSYRFAHAQVHRFEFQNVAWEQEPACRGGHVSRWRAQRRKKKGRHPHEAGCITPDADGRYIFNVPYPWEEGRFRPTTLVRIRDEDFIARLPGARHAPPPFAKDALAPSIVADAYRGIRISYENAANYAEAGAFHYREMEMRRLSARRDKRRWPEAAALWLYKHLGRYGDSAARPLGLLFLLVAGWAFLPVALAWLRSPWAGGAGQEPLTGASGNGTAQSQAAASGAGTAGGATGEATGGVLELLLDALRDVLGSRIIADSFPGFLVQMAGLSLVILFGVGLRRRYRRGSAGGGLS